jgi:hypothetical protein
LQDRKSGKTYTLIKIAEELKPKSALYLAYNKAIATEAAEKFKGTVVECRTIHSLAYTTIKSKYNIRISKPRPSDIQAYYSYEEKIDMLDIIEDYCLSGSLSIEDHMKRLDADMNLLQPIKDLLNKMAIGKMPSSHSFYLKLYHIELASNRIPAPEYELLMLDEFADVTELTIEIFQLIKAKKKVAVGDSSQNLYSFIKTINGFEYLDNQGILLKLTTSYRVESNIARDIEEFMRTYIDPSISFKGQKYKKIPKIKTKAFISRNNSTLIKVMIDMNSSNIKYSLTRKASHIFALPLTLLNLSPNKDIYMTEYAYLKKDADRFFKKSKNQKKGLFAYLLELHPLDAELKSAVKLISSIGPNILYETYNTAKANESAKHNTILTTAHSSKG